jgi:hypothetical protein
MFRPPARGPGGRRGWGDTLVLGLVAHLGLTDALIPKADRESPESRRRGLGVVLSAHRDETLVVESDDAVLTLRLEKRRQRFDGAPATRYRFVLLGGKRIPTDEGP